MELNALGIALAGAPTGYCQRQGSPTPITETTITANADNFDLVSGGREIPIFNFSPGPSVRSNLNLRNSYRTQRRKQSVVLNGA